MRKLLTGRRLLMSRGLIVGTAVALPAAFLTTAFLPAVSVPTGSASTESASTASMSTASAAAAFRPGDLHLAGAAEAGPDLAALVTLKDIKAHLTAFQKIADSNGGDRAAGGTGYKMSVRYVTGRLRKAGLVPLVQKFTFPYWRERTHAAFARMAPSKESYKREVDFVTLAFSGSGDVTAPVTAVDIPAKGEGTSGCEAGDFKGFTRGSIALIQRGTCTFAAKAAKARAAGASAVVIFNKPGEKGPVEGTLSKPTAFPVIGPSHKVGASLVKAARKGGLRLRVKTDTAHGRRSSENVIADTPGGRADNVVLAGAHLDSVPDGPGINDNGTGAATLLAVAGKIDKLGGAGLRNRVRFAFWGAEEEGLRGSAHYVRSLPAAQRERIALNLNFDMLGSPNGRRGVYDGDHSTGTGTAAPAGSGAIESLFRQYFEGRRLPVAESQFNGRSDYGPFIERGIPAGGIDTGAEELKTAAEAKVFGGKAGKAYDPCYHAKCDRLKNVDLKLLDGNADGVAHVLQHLARTTSAVNGGSRFDRSQDPSYDPLRQGPYLLR
ncbi:M28 family peptidase [Actinomadura sp. WMMA1423]|uniref:M28 family peptidase n=1 Tax=Actinomadura sp. WMMA1423 TaxID=2591108 RepID=UPI001F0DADC3|nr:M28 family peptidase [Actinomadura sp. WMMA1423]